MNVTTTKTGDLNAVLTVKISPEDYQQKVEKVLKDYRKNAKIPGFRPGMVPAGLIKKQYGKAVLIDEVNHLLQHAVTDHLRDEKLDILGNPLPVPNDDIDWDNQSEFSFDFELGLAPEFDLKVSDKIKVPYAKITADKKMVDRYVEDYTKRFGKMSSPESVEENCIIKGEFVEVDKDGNAVEEGITASASIGLDSLDDKKTVKALTGLKAGDKVTIDSKKAFKDDFNFANVIGSTKDALEASTGLFEITISEITKIDPAELNQELFDKVFGEGAVKDEKEFRARIKEDAEGTFVGESDRKFYEDVKEAVLDKTKFDLPDEFLKKWMQTSQERPVSAEEIEVEYPKMQDSLKWQLVESKLVKENGIEVSQEELVSYTKELVARQMAQYGQQPEEKDLEDIAKRVLENQEEAQRIADQLFGDKLMKFFKETVKINEKEVSFDEFVKMLSK